MKDVSIEYAHIYTNSEINQEHKTSLEVLDSIEYKNESLVIMVDDYSFPDPTFDYDALVAWLTEQGHKPNLIFRESQLIPVCDEVLKMLPEEKLKKQLVDYIKSNKYPCSLFIAAWYLLRLGKIEHKMFPESERAESLINILPKSFEPFEQKGFEIIAQTPFSEVISKIENKYIEGRIIG